MSGSNRNPSRKLTFDDAVKVWLMYLEGHFQHRIAAAFDTNPGRVNEIVKERTHLGSKAEALRRRTTAA